MIRTRTETELKMAELYKNGKTMREIAYKFGVSTATVCVHLKRYISIFERRKRQYKFQKTDEKILEEIKDMYKKGHSSVAIGKKFKIAPDTVMYHLKKMKVDTSRGNKYRPKIDADKFNKIKEIYEETRSILKTAQKMNLHPSSVHYRLVKKGIIKKKALNQKVAREKYESFTGILITLFEKMGYQIRYVQERYNGHGPDMIIENEKESVLIEHKATIKRSWYWQHALEEIKTNLPKYSVTKAIVVTTAKKPKNYKSNGTEIIFFDDLKKLLEKNGLRDLIPKIESISNTPSI